MHLLHKFDSLWKMFKLGFFVFSWIDVELFILILEILIHTLGMRKFCLFM